MFIDFGLMNVLVCAAIPNTTDQIGGLPKVVAFIFAVDSAMFLIFLIIVQIIWNLFVYVCTEPSIRLAQVFVSTILLSWN